MDLERRDLLYDGKSKRVWSTEDDRYVLLEFKDDATAFNGVKHALIDDKARINCAISTYLFDRLAEVGIAHHMVSRVSDTSILCERVRIIPVEVVVRNVVAGSFAKRYGLVEGEPLRRSLVEYFYKSDELNDPLMGEDVPIVLGWAKKWEMVLMTEQALQINDLLRDFWAGHRVDLLDFKLEFGRTADGRIVLADEITPDGARMWERGSGRHLDKDVFRRDMGDLSATYHEIYRRVFGEDLDG